MLIDTGHGIVAANTSIPTKFQTIIIDNGDRKGFNAKSKRFSDNVLVSLHPY